MSDIKDFRPLEGQECTTRIVLGTPCKDDDEDGDELEWLARNKRAPPHTTRVREYPSIRYTYTVRYRVYPPLVSRDSRDSEPVPLVTQRIYRTPYATGAAWCERGRETYQPVRMRRRQFQPARSTNGKARQRRSAGRSTCSQSERLNNVVWFGHDNTSTSVVMFSFFRILIACIQPIKLRKNENSIGWKRFGSFISLHLAYRRKSVCFLLILRGKKFFFKKKRSKLKRQTHFFGMSQTSFISFWTFSTSF